MKHQRAFKYRFYPTPEQIDLLLRTFGCARYVYNWGLELKSNAWTLRQERVSYVDMAGQLAALKKQDDTAWLNEVSSVVLQQSLRHLDTGFRNFFAGRTGYPVFKRRSNAQSATLMSNAFTFREGVLVLAKMKEPLAVRWSRDLPAEALISSVTVSRDAAGRYFVSMLVEDEIQPLPVSGKTAGIDVGLKSFAVLSDGTAIANPKHLAGKLARLKRYQRGMARKMEVVKATMGLKGKAIPKGVMLPRSNNHQKLAHRVARLHARVADTRNDFLHQTSTRIVRDNQAICVEDLAVKNMVKNRRLSRGISDASWSRFRSMLEYKSQWYGRDFVATDRWLPSSKRCSECGYTLAELSLATRCWACPDCGVVHDRDINAARNILAEGLKALASQKQLPVDYREITPVRLPQGGDMKLASKELQRRNPSSREVGIPSLRAGRMSMPNLPIKGWGLSGSLEKAR